MKHQCITRYCVLAALGLAMTTGISAQDTLKNRIDDTKDRILDRPLSTTTDINRHDSKAVAKVNKASSLTGMAVRNNANEKLGDVKDIVFDLSTGKIGYVVLSVGGFLGIGDKLIAVPPSAFTSAPDGDALLLDADKAKLQAAPGFAQTAWPSVHDPTFGTYWKTDRDALGTSGTGTEIRKERSPLDTRPATETPKRD